MSKTIVLMAFSLLTLASCAPSNNSAPQSAAAKFGAKNLTIGSTWIMTANRPQNVGNSEIYEITVRANPTHTLHNNLYFASTAGNLKSSVFLVEDKDPIFYVVVFKNPNVTPDDHTDEGSEDAVRCVSQFDDSLRVGDTYKGISFFGTGIDFNEALRKRQSSQFGTCTLLKKL